MSTYVIHDCQNCGTDHEWTFTFPSLTELFLIKEVTAEVDQKTHKTIVPGMNGAEFMQGLGNFDPLAWATLIHVLHKRDGITIPVKKIALDIEALVIDGKSIAESAAEAAGDEDIEDDEDEESEDPTPTSGRRTRAA